MDPVVLQCIFNKLITTVDGGYRISLDAAEHMAQECIDISKLRGESLFAVIMTEQQYHSFNKK